MAQLTDIDSEVSGFFKIQDLGPFIGNLFQLIIGVGSIAALAFLFWGGIQFITSGGDQEETKSAKNKISSALYGFIILAVIWVLWRLIMYFLGLSPDTKGPLNLIIPTP